jgi:NAD-dependent SIR2 family protein deacetylase
LGDLRKSAIMASQHRIAIPVHEPAQTLCDLLSGRRVVVLAGAGCSTESGIPDYRGPQSAMRTRTPMMYQEFVGSAAARARYWARSAVGWHRVAAAQPNAAHAALARLEQAGVVLGIITQNVDGLHHAAGSRRVVELHGSLEWVRCLSCQRTERRHEYQARLESLNAEWRERYAHNHIALAPDGDAELPASALEGFQVPPCTACNGMIKPDVVFFGENVPAERVNAAWQLFESGDALLIVGSSLTVYSGRRFVQRAERDGIPIAVVNLGPTRADAAAAVKVDGPAGAVLTVVANTLTRGT